MTRTTRKPLPTLLAMSTAPLGPTPSPLPFKHKFTDEEYSSNNGNDSISAVASETHTATRPHPLPSFPSPKLWLKCQNLCHPGSQRFFQTTDPSCCLPHAVRTVLEILYQPQKSNSHIPPTRSVTLVIRSMDGVAYTTGSDLDDDHKEIHLSLDYIKNVQPSTQERIGSEIRGVLVHEMVHAWQWNGQGKAPGGLIEGIADYVRLKAGLSPPHWKKEVPSSWDAGYQHTAYFLEWLDEYVSMGSVRRMNATLKDEEYDEASFWRPLFGRNVDDLFEEYKSYLETVTLSKEQTQLSMEDSAFWDLVQERKGREQTIVMKAKWRTQRHLQRDSCAEEDNTSRVLKELWLDYASSLESKRAASVNVDRKQGDTDKLEDESPVLISETAEEI